MRKIKVLYVEPRKEPRVIEIADDYKEMQELVGGYFEFVSDPNGKCIVCCNDEGKINGMEPNRRWYDDIICGNFFVTKSSRNGNLLSLTDKDIDNYKEVFKDASEISPEDVKSIGWNFYFI